MLTCFAATDMEQKLRAMRPFFDVVRLVDPIAGLEYSLDSGRPVATQHHCYAVWNRDAHCSNCSSKQALHGKCRAMKFEFKEGETFVIQSQYACVDGQELVLELVSNVSNHLLLDAAGGSLLIQQVSNYNKALHEDALSGLANRRCFDEQSDIYYRKAAVSGQCLSVAFLDIDNFKNVNDQYGHLAGDEVIRQLAALMQRYCRRQTTDLLARYGGDEFVMVLTGIKPALLQKRLQDLLEHAEKLTGANIPPDISLSIGVACGMPTAEGHVTELLLQADRALYRAKAQGKGQLCFSDSLQEPTKEPTKQES